MLRQDPLQTWIGIPRKWLLNINMSTHYRLMDTLRRISWSITSLTITIAFSQTVGVILLNTVIKITYGPQPVAATAAAVSSQECESRLSAMSIGPKYSSVRVGNRLTTFCLLTLNVAFVARFTQIQLLGNNRKAIFFDSHFEVFSLSFLHSDLQ